MNEEKAVTDMITQTDTYFYITAPDKATCIVEVNRGQSDFFLHPAGFLQIKLSVLNAGPTIRWIMFENEFRRLLEWMNERLVELDAEIKEKK